MRTVLATCFVSRLAVIAVLAAGLPFARPAAAQGVGVQASGGEPQVIIASEFKTIKDTTKEVQTTEEPTKPWSVYTNVGYTSEYNFRGTNLTPDADGAIFATANISYSGEYGSLTLGVYGIHQFGTAKANAFSISEGGGGGAQTAFTSTAVDDTDPVPDARFVGKLFPETIQSEFDEIDVYLTYLFQLGPVDITVGNIAFFINRRAETRVTTRGTLVDPDETPPTMTVNQTVTIPTVGDEQFDRLFVELSAPRLIHFGGISIVPKVRYYQTILNTGDDPLEGSVVTLATNVTLPEGPHDITVTGTKERNDSLGGYLEGRIDAVFPITDRIRVKPYGIISYSFHDRSEPFSGNIPARNLFRSASLVGFNHAQFGVTVPIEVWRGSQHCVLSIEPFGAYSYHISHPTAGTDRNEVWGGAQAVLTF